MFFRMVYKSGHIFLPFCHNARVWRTDRQTDRILLAIPRLHYMQRSNKTGVVADRSFTLRKWGFWTFLLLWPWSDDLHIRTWLVFPGDIPDVQIWTPYVTAFESYRLTDRQTYIHPNRHDWNSTADLGLIKTKLCYPVMSVSRCRKLLTQTVDDLRYFKKVYNSSSSNSSSSSSKFISKEDHCNCPPTRS